MSKFDLMFSEVVEFFPEGMYVSKNIFKTKEKAAEAFFEYLEEVGGGVTNPITPQDVKEAWVRYQFVPEDLRYEIGEAAWLTCEKEARNAQSCWVYGV